MNSPTKVELTKVTIKNGFLELKVKEQYEIQRNIIFDKNKTGQNADKNLELFSYYGNKLRQLARLKHKLTERELA